MRITQHVPNFVDMGDAPSKVADVGSRDELLAVPWVAGWANDVTDPSYCVSDNRLMIDGIRHGKRWWWVIGYLSEDPGWLPAWVPPEPERCPKCGDPLNSSGNCHRCYRPNFPR
jgi:hypothetical protein